MAEHDECPASGPWDFPQPLIRPMSVGRWSEHPIIWRPWFTEGTDLFGFFQVDVLTHFVLIETMVVGGGKEKSISKRQRDSYGHRQG